MMYACKNSTNINKMNNHLSLQSIITSHFNPLNRRKTTTYNVGNADPGLGQAHKCVGVKQVNEIPTTHFK
jgi:hypothetical protein